MTTRSQLPERPRPGAASKRPSARHLGADLRGQGFEGASLAGVDLAGVRAGIPTGDRVILVAIALVISLALGLLTGWSAGFLRSIIDSGAPAGTAIALSIVASVVVLLGAGMWKGNRAARVVLPVIAVLFAVQAALAFLTVAAATAALMLFAFVFLAAAVLGLGALVRAVAVPVMAVTIVIVAALGGFAGGAAGGLPALVIAAGAALAGRQAMKQSDRYPLLARLCVEVACRRGTRFRDTDLRGARFAGARLEACDFRGADLRGTSFDDARLTMCIFDGERDVPAVEPLLDHDHREVAAPTTIH